jgi:hypothetical protein
MTEARSMGTDASEIIFRFLDRKAFSAEDVLSCSDSELVDLACELSIALRPEIKPRNESFSFVANSSLSGGQFPCSALDCRLAKLDEVTSFAAMYADEVFIQDPFEKVALKAEHSNSITQADRSDIAFGILAYWHVLPLIEKGLVKYAQSSVSLCSHHEKHLADPLHKRLDEERELVYRQLFAEMLDTCSVSYDVKPERGHF